jgi:hypothetical protein
VSQFFKIFPFLLAIEEKQRKVERRNCNTIGRSFTNCPPVGAEEASQKVAENNQKRLIFIPFSVPVDTILLASKARQVKRGVKEVVKGIRKGEKGYIFCHFSKLNLTDILVQKFQTPCSCGRHKPHGHHLTSPCNE